MNETIEILTAEEEAAEVQRLRDRLAWAQSLTPDQINYLCDGGWYNKAIKGYLIAAAENAGQSREQIVDLLDGLRIALSEQTKEDAERTCARF